MAKEPSQEQLVGQLRQNRRLLLIAALFGIVAVILMQIYISSKTNVLGNMVQTVVASQNIAIGDVFQDSNVELQEYPERYIGQYPVPPEMLNTILNRRSKVDLKRGEPIRWSFVQGSELRGGLALDEQKRAMSVSVDQVSGMANLLQPGDKVDIIATFDDIQVGRTSYKLITKTILEYVTVIAVDNQTEKVSGLAGLTSGFGNSGYSTVTLEVSSEEAEMLIFATNRAVGNLHLIKRNEEDYETVGEDHVTIQNFFTLQGRLSQQKREDIDRIRKHVIE